MRLVLLADTHVPKRARDLPPQVWKAVDGADVVVHAGTGSTSRCSAEYADAAVLVFGYSHISWDTVTPSGLRLLNPGSPTDRRRQPYCTYLSAEVAAGRLGEVVLHRLPPRGQPASSSSRRS